MSRFVTGVTIVTTRAGEELHGMTCNAFCSISITPLTVMVCLAKNTRTEKLLEKGHVFAVNPTFAVEPVVARNSGQIAEISPSL